MDKCTECPECGCREYTDEGWLGEGFRICTECSQEWWTNINYRKYMSPIYYEIFTQGGRSLPPKDRNGDANYFDKRSAKRRIKKLVKHGWTVTAFVTRPGKKREMIYSNWPENAMNAIGI